jgi:hypothetical protein
MKIDRLYLLEIAVKSDNAVFHIFVNLLFHPIRGILFLIPVFVKRQDTYKK